jgi:hypothetical protein
MMVNTMTTRVKPKRQSEVEIDQLSGGVSVQLRCRPLDEVACFPKQHFDEAGVGGVHVW